MAFVLIDTFIFRSEGYDRSGNRIPSPTGYFTVTEKVYYDSDTDKFKVEQKSLGDNGKDGKFPMLYSVLDYERGRAENSLISSNCNGTNKISFFAIYTNPFIRREIAVNSTDCGFIVPPPPPPPTPPPPPPVCDLAVTATSAQLTGLKAKDGTITANISYSSTGYCTVTLFKGTEQIENVVLSSDIDSYTFSNLDAGDYTVKASLIDFTCESQTDITVLPVSFNEKYYFEYCETRFGFRPIKISLKKKNYSGASTLIPEAQKVVSEINWKAESEYKFEPIMGSSCDVNLISESDFEYADLFITEEQDTLLEIYVDDILFWTGYLTADKATEDFKSPPYSVTLSALDGIKLLKDQDFDLSDKYISFLEAIKFILDKTNISLPFRTMCDIEDVTVGNDYKLLTGLDVNVYGNNIVTDAGTATINDTNYTLGSNTFTLPDLPAGVYEKIYYINSTNTFAYLSNKIDDNALIIATIIQNVSGVTAKKTRYANGDVFNDHMFNVNVFQKNEAEYTDCTTVLEFICRQFSCQVKQSNGYWVIENIGSKARLNTRQYTYDNNLNLIENDIIDLLKDIDCSQGINTVLSGGNISLITGDKKATVHWTLGYPKPIFGNWNFENWFLKDGVEIPSKWQVTQPYGWFNKGAKFDRIYDPTTGVLTDVENGSYYFNIKRGTSVNKAFKSTDIIVFSQEVININLQLIITNKNKTTGRYIIGFKFKIGNYICANHKIGKVAFDPIWVIDDGTYTYEFIADFDDTKFIPFGDDSNITLTLPPSPVQGSFNILLNTSFITSVVGNTGVAGLALSDIGFDNFKVSKTSPVTNVKVIEDATITVENGNKFSNIPDDFEVVMGDVETNLRTDGIRTLNRNITQLWARKDVEENEALNNIICKELLSQYQQNTRIFMGKICGQEMTVRNIFNLPTLDLYRFVPISFKYDIGECIANISMVEVYAKDGLSSGSIGGGSGGSPNIVPLGYILASKNNIFTDGNDNLLKSE